MNSGNETVKWTTIATYLDKMHQAAETNDWSLVADLEKERLPYLKNYFQTSINNKNLNASRIKSQIMRVQASDDEILKMCTASRSEALQQIKQARLGKKAKQAYSENR